jgi:hypothetical protein
VTRASSSFPWPRSPPEEGHVPLVDVFGLHSAVVAALGTPLQDDDPLWTVFEHLYAHRPQFEPSLLALVEEAKQEGKLPVRLGNPSAAGPRHDEFLAVIDGWKTKGVLAALTPAEQADPDVCAVISPLKSVIKGPIRLSEAAKLAIEQGNLGALHAAAEVQARSIVTALKDRLSDPSVAAHLHPAAVLDEVLFDHTDAASIRMCHNGYHLGQHVHPFSFSYEDWGDFLREHEPEAKSARVDGESFFYHISYAEEAKKFLCVEYNGLVYRYNRLSMGLKCSAGTASLLSAVVVFIATLRGARGLSCYVDDFIFITRHVPESVVILRGVLKVANIHEASKKFVPERAVNDIMGRTYNAPLSSLSLPLGKMYTYHVIVAVADELLADTRLQVRRAVGRTFLERVRGALGWWADSTSRGKAHLGGLNLALSRRIDTPLASTPTVIDAARANLSFWRNSWANGNHLSPAVIVSPTSNVVNVTGGAGRAPASTASDAGDVAAGAVFGDEALHHVWQSDELDKPPDWRELQMTLRSFRKWAPLWSSRRLIVLTDNQSNFYAINAGRAKGSITGAANTVAIDELYDLAERFGFSFQALWLPRESNVLPDMLSKCADSAAARSVCAAAGLRLVCQ